MKNANVEAMENINSVINVQGFAINAQLNAKKTLVTAYHAIINWYCNLINATYNACIAPRVLRWIPFQIYHVDAFSALSVYQK